MNLQKLDSQVTKEGRATCDDTLNEIIHILHRIRDFENVYNICEGTFKQHENKFSVRDEFDVVKRSTKLDCKKKNVVVSTLVDGKIPDQVKTSQQIFRQTVMNLVQGAIFGDKDVQVNVFAKHSKDKVIVEVVNSRNELNKHEVQHVAQICQEEVLANILETTQVDINLKIALVLARQVGWPIDFFVEGSTSKFRMVVPVQLVDEQAPRLGLNLVPEPIMEHSVENTPAHSRAPEMPVDGVDCLLVSCSDLVPLFEELGLRSDESFLEESAINSVQRALRK